jgi:acylphosphatase
VSEKDASQRREVSYCGMVQGVGFRYTARWIASQFSVTGYVENLPDGRVLLVAEGAAGELDRFLAVISRELGRYIDAAQQTVAPATGQFQRFEIRH